MITCSRLSLSTPPAWKPHSLNTGFGSPSTACASSRRSTTKREDDQSSKTLPFPRTSTPGCELLRYRAKWACELVLNSAPTPGGSPVAVVGGGCTAGAMAKFDNAGADCTQSLRAGERPRPPADAPPEASKRKSRSLPRNRKRGRNSSQEDGEDANQYNRRPALRESREAPVSTCAPSNTTGTPQQELSVGGKGGDSSEGWESGLSIAGPACAPAPPAR